MSKKPLLDQILDTSIRVGDLLVPAGSIESYVGKFAHPLLQWTHDETYKISILGSATGILSDERRLLICSKHQLKDRDISDIGLLFPDGSNIVTISGSRVFNDGEHAQETDAFDVAALNFSEPIAQYPELGRDFYPFVNSRSELNTSRAHAFLIAGYPSSDQKYDLEEHNRLGFVRRLITAKFDSQPADNALHKLKFIQPLDFDPDGLSGGPAFAILQTEREPCLSLGGIVLRAGREFCYILKADYISEFLQL